jgi:hypothetical protein
VIRGFDPKVSGRCMAEGERMKCEGGKVSGGQVSIGRKSDKGER